MKLKGFLFNSILVFASTLIGFVLFELGWWVWAKQWPRGQVDFSKRIMFFDAPRPIYQNAEEISFYAPNNTVRTKTIYFADTSYDIEYDYTFRTNNFGLVQDQDVRTGKPSLLFLGDSFTEGQGAEPWFRAIAPQIEKFGLQPINGGIPGVGFEQFWKVENFLAGKGVQLEKLAVIFISDDFRRTVWKFPENVLNCVNRTSPCDGTESRFALPAEAEIPGWVDKIRRLRAAKGPPSQATIFSTKLPATFQVYTFLGAFMYPVLPNPETVLQQKASQVAVREMLKKYGPLNVVFIHLPQKDEVGHRSSDLGLDARRVISDAGGSLYDGFKECHLSLADFHVHDGHPNKTGYGKIASCVANALPLIGLKMPVKNVSEN